MIPISDNIPSSSKPIGNYLLIGINMALFLWELKLEIAGELGDLVNSWCRSRSDYCSNGKRDHKWKPAAWIALLMLSSSLLLGIFLSFSQILGNLIFLWVFGKSIDILGHGRFLVFYLLSGILTGVVQILAEPTLTMPLIGANGAIAGVLGAYLLSFPKAKKLTRFCCCDYTYPHRVASTILFWWFVQQMFYGIGSLNIAGGVNPASIAYWAHGVGLVIAVLVRLCHRG